MINNWMEKKKNSERKANIKGKLNLKTNKKNPSHYFYLFSLGGI